MKIYSRQLKISQEMLDLAIWLNDLKEDNEINVVKLNELLLDIDMTEDDNVTLKTIRRFLFEYTEEDEEDAVLFKLRWC